MAAPREKRHRFPQELYRGNVTVAFTVCVAEGRPLFTDGAVVAAFVLFLRTAVEHNNCTVPIDCFMPDHLHVLIHGRSDLSDSRQAIVEFKQHSGYWLKQHRPDMKWQKDFYDHIIRREEDLGAQVRYVAANPVRKRLVSDWRKYPYTGAIGIDLEAVIDSTITL